MSQRIADLKHLLPLRSACEQLAGDSRVLECRKEMVVRVIDKHANLVVAFLQSDRQQSDLALGAAWSQAIDKQCYAHPLSKGPCRHFSAPAGVDQAPSSKEPDPPACLDGFKAQHLESMSSIIASSGLVWPSCQCMLWSQ
jgi:hypothetical protein